MNIVYLGSGAFGIPTLSALAARHTILAIITQPDKPAGRSRATTPTPIAQWATEHLPDAPILRPASVNDPAARDHIRSLAVGTTEDRAGAFVVIAFGQKLSGELLEGRFAINLHASLLPRWRGAAPINHAILAGDARTGNSVITLASRMDAGLVLGRSEVALDPATTAGELHDSLATLGPPLVLDVLDQFEHGRLRPVPQAESEVTLAPKLAKAHGFLDPELPAERWRAQIHGLNPWPGVTVSFRDAPLRLHRAEVAAGALSPGAAAPGTVLDPAAGIIACGSASTLRLIEVQPANKRPMMWAEFARGARIEAGERLTRFAEPC